MSQYMALIVANTSPECSAKEVAPEPRAGHIREDRGLHSDCHKNARFVATEALRRTAGRLIRDCRLRPPFISDRNIDVV